MEYDKNNKEKLFVFGDGQVRCAGTVQLKLCTGSSEAQVRAVVCSEVRGALLIGWKDMIKLRLLNPSFPAAEAQKVKPMLGCNLFRMKNLWLTDF